VAIISYLYPSFNALAIDVIRSTSDHEASENELITGSCYTPDFSEDILILEDGFLTSVEVRTLNDGAITLQVRIKIFFVLP